MKKENNVVRQEEVGVVVIRKQRIIDKVFTISVAALVTIIYINFGCALQWTNLWSIIKSPAGPLIGLTGQFLVMPVVSKISYTNLGFSITPSLRGMQKQVTNTTLLQ